MPVVPRNTISEPSGARLPEVGMAKPRIAEAMGAVASALGQRASSIGRLAGAAGDQADVIGRMTQDRLRTEAFKHQGRMAQLEGMSNLANTLVQTGANIDRIYQRRSIEQAENVLTEYTAFVNQAADGTIDQAGGRIPGTLETPYSPGNEKDDATGPSIATAKAIRDWMENENGSYAKMSPAAKAEFDKLSARVTQSVLDRAMRKEYNQIQAFRQANNKAAFDANRQMLQNQSTDISPQGDSAWMADMMAARDAQIMREVGQYQKDPSNQSIANAEWSNPQVAKYVADSERTYVSTFTTDRVAVLLSAAQVEPDDARREALLDKAVAVSAMTYRDQPILSKLAQDKAKLDAANVRTNAIKMKAEIALSAENALRDTSDDVMENPTEKTIAAHQKAKEAALAAGVNPIQIQAIEVEQANFRANTQIGKYNHLLATDQQSAAVFRMTMDPYAQAVLAQKEQGSTGSVKKPIESQYKIDRVKAAINLRGILYRDKNGRPVVRTNMHTTELRGMAAQLHADGDITSAEHDEMVKEINAGKKDPPIMSAYVQESILEIEKQLGTDIVDNAILLQDGRITIGLQAEGSDKGEPIDIFANGDDEIPYYGQSSVTTKGRLYAGRDAKAIYLDAKAVQAITQYVVDYYRSNPLPDPKTGRIKNTSDLVRECLRPENIPVAVHDSMMYNAQAMAERWTPALYRMQENFIQQHFESIDRQYGVSK